MKISLQKISIFTALSLRGKAAVAFVQKKNGAIQARFNLNDLVKHSFRMMLNLIMTYH